MMSGSTPAMPQLTRRPIGFSPSRCAQSAPAMTTAAATQRSKREPPARLLTIGAVCRGLKSEFPDISISKIRYLEDQGLLTPKRTRGGYRLFSEEDVERLETILRLQRDEAVIALELQNIVEVRLGAGVYVLEPSANQRAGSSGPELTIGPFELMEARIADIHAAIQAGTLTTTELARP